MQYLICMMSLYSLETNYRKFPNVLNISSSKCYPICVCDGEVLLFVAEKCEMLQIKASEYSSISLMELHILHINVFIDTNRQKVFYAVARSLPPELVYQNITSVKCFN